MKVCASSAFLLRPLAGASFLAAAGAIAGAGFGLGFGSALARAGAAFFGAVGWNSSSLSSESFGFFAAGFRFRGGALARALPFPFLPFSSLALISASKS